MGEVYRARDERLNRDVALKILSSELASSSEHLRRFQQEAHAASALNHPNIITIYDIGMVGETAYIAMELVDGQDLRSLYAGQRLPLKNILRIAVKVADGLAAAHERGIVHRDLKPENVMISRDGFVKILDFGLAKLVRPVSETMSTAPHTMPGAVFGTVAYMSPEQASARTVDFRSDQFSLGLILYELLTGRMPFSEATAAETLASIIRNEAPPPSSVNPEVPPDLDRVIARCLAKEPAERYASTRDLARDLREIRDRISMPSEPRYRTDRPPVRPARRMAWVTGAAIGLALVAIGTVMTLRERAPAVQPHGPQSVAVLPFRDLSGTEDGQIFADGIAEMIRSRLGESHTLHVIPAFDAGTHGDPTAAARRIGAAYAVTGSVQRVGNDVDLSVSVINATTGEQAAGKALKGSMNDIFALHNRAVEVILGGMNVRAEAQARTSPPDLTAPSDQTAYVQALGLLQMPRDEKTVDRAIAILEHLLLDARDSAPVNAQLARALLYKAQMGRRPELIEQATLYAERAAGLDDSDPEIHLRLGQLRNAAGRYPEAEREYRRALALRPNDAEAYACLADTSKAMGRAADAEAMYRKAIALEPNRATFYNRYAAFLFAVARYQDAAANFRRFTELLPSAIGFSNLGGAYQALGSYDEAQKAYEKSIALEPTSDAYVNLGTVYFYAGRYADACRALEKASTLSPASHYAWLALGDAYAHTPDRSADAKHAYEMTVKTANDTIAVNPRDAVAYADSANALAKLGRGNEAARSNENALKLDPTNQTVLYSAAVVSLRRGKPESAIGWLQRAVASGYPRTDLLRDPEFAALHGDPSFPRQVTQHP